MRSAFVVPQTQYDFDLAKMWKFFASAEHAQGSWEHETHLQWVAHVGYWAQSRWQRHFFEEPSSDGIPLPLPLFAVGGLSRYIYERFGWAVSGYIVHPTAIVDVTHAAGKKRSEEADIAITLLVSLITVGSLIIKTECRAYRDFILVCRAFCPRPVKSQAHEGTCM